MTTKKQGLLCVRPKAMIWNKHMKKFGKRLFWKKERQLEKKAFAHDLKTDAPDPDAEDYESELLASLCDDAVEQLFDSLPRERSRYE